MDFFDKASSVIDQGVNAAYGAVSDALVEQADFVQKFIRLCDEGWKQGWHERNGGNLTYRLTDEEVEEFSKHFTKESEWVNMGVSSKLLAGSYFLTTGSGRYMSNVKSNPSYNIGIVEINDEGDSWRIVWGLDDGGKPTSEFPTHFMNHVVRVKATDGACRLIYHAHPANIIAMTSVCPLESRYFTRALWKAMTECVVIFPCGVGVVPWMVPGGAEIAKATSVLTEKYDAAVWAQRGLFVSGEDFDSTFGLMHTIEKAAEIYRLSRQMNAGSDEFLNTITDDNLRQIGKDFNLVINEDFLD